MTMENSATSPALMASSVGRLDDLDVRAVDGDRGRSAVVIGDRRVVGLVGRVDGDRVRDEPAVGGIGRAHDVDAGRGAGGEVGRPEGQARRATIDQPLAAPSIVQLMPAGRVSEPVAP